MNETGYCQGLCANLILVSGRNLLQGGFGVPLVTFRRSGRKGSRAAAATCLALDTSRADCHSPDQQVLLDDLKMLHVHVFLQPHWVPATWRSLAQTSIRAEFPSGNVPTTRVLRRISRFSSSFSVSSTLPRTNSLILPYYNKFGQESRAASPAFFSSLA